MRVLVAMSGGIDSAVAALLLKRQGHEVVGMTLRVHDDPERTTRAKSCCAPRDMLDAREVAVSLGIPYYAVDVREAFHERVIRPFAQDYLNGKTPSPCVTCNSDFKFGLLFQRAKALGFDHVATGHYVRKVRDAESQKFKLLRGLDPDKDQSYFLFALTPEQLACAVFPLGDLKKCEVRALARQEGLGIAEKPESQEICFVSKKSYAQVVEDVLPQEAQAVKGTSADICDMKGNVVGHHKGIHHYTVGQRRGLGLSAPEALYVTGIDPSERRVIVGPEAALYRQDLLLERVSWLDPPPAIDSCQTSDSGMRAEVSIRYRHKAARARLYPSESGTLRVVFEESQRAISPGQAAVFYHEDQVLGGGWIVA